MALAVYAVVPAGARVTGTGVFRDRLRLVRGSRASLVVEEMRPEDEPSREHAPAFGDVLARLFEQGPVLPVRFGTTVEDAFAARDLLSQRSPAWGERLDAVRGHHEQVVHIDAGPRSSDRSSGRAYLASRAASLHADEQLLADLSETVAPYVTETRPLRPRAGLRLACLVPHENSELLDQALDRWAADRGVVARTTGPWPPFSFAEPEETT
jgi:hypothetical protein